MGDAILKLKSVRPVILSLMLVNTTYAADGEGGVTVEPVSEETIFNALSQAAINPALDNSGVNMTTIEAPNNNNS